MIRNKRIPIINATICVRKPNIYCYHGYAKTIKALLYNCNIDVDVYGYEDKTFESGYVLEKLREHQIDSDSLVKKLVR